ncbi:EAL domain-containing protein [Gracilibacillus kekensis]|uniref:EAL domain, c-di-GMP-specific phosphodiesterase class I (Or its enzymatically inactive variant) n=1 Tax=Gracilibacillus kekensis TaxID=1027249 RepID=A0A1M7QWE1_9BACI|nr:EAL-associated domain-containing protein [Gracilibacillus kekensis]SHN36228.1 EAL domain, c-di-GMP-specific phosphodiesterase class I (or its enzymatically inactive variant) [Gracilibacillus kekensis]
MDPLDVMIHVDKIKPYFQAIFSADSHEIVGYEVLGKLEMDKQLISLGSFFHDSSVPDDFKMEMDQRIQDLAFKKYLDENIQVSLYLNVHANYFETDKEDQFLNHLLSYQKEGLDLSKIVIEITEHQFRSDIELFTHTLKYLKTLGVKIAIDDLGTGSSNLDQISLMEPDILKVNLQSLQNESMSISYHSIIYSLSLLARKLGAELLFNGISSNYHFHYAWRNHGRYYQGDFLYPTSNQFVEIDILKDRFRKDIQQYIKVERQKLTAKFQLATSLDHQIQDKWKQMKKNRSLDELINMLAKEMEHIFFRIYVTDEDGFQKTVNFLHMSNEWKWDITAKGKNWSWRPYFIENVIRMKEEKTGILSDIYNDIETGERIRTFSYPLDDSLYLFMDISPMYLDEHQDLLW